MADVNTPNKLSPQSKTTRLVPSVNCKIIPPQVKYAEFNATSEPSALPRRLEICSIPFKYSSYCLTLTSSLSTTID